MNERRIRITTLLAAFAFASGGSAQASGDPPSKTRFGQLSVEYGGPLLLDDKPLQPEIRGNESIDILNVFRMGPRDVILLQDNGGSGCPAQFMFITLDKSGAKTSVEFGTCATAVRVRRNRDSVIVSMPLLYGKGSKSYVFRDGAVSEGGKVLK
jgi:hypothetical protein